VVVNNAGYFLLGNFESFTTAQLERQFAANFFGVTYVMRAALPVMRRQRSGHIINISSLAGLIGLKDVSAYAATKFAVEGLSLSVAHEVEPFGIKVTLVEPGFFRTELVAPQSMDYGERAIEGYEALQTLKATWGAYHHQQQGDPAKLGKALLELAAMEKPPRQFLAGSDAVAAVQPALEARLEEIRAHADLSKSTDGTF
jgi:NAD(P)-dependent dehydrogenase (short-subunit alcohol dehydrogenase family)